MNTVYVAYEETSHGGEVINPNQKWSRYTDKYIDISVTGLYIDEPDSLYWDTVELKCNPELNDRVYLLVVRYESGDTFSNSYGNAYFEGVYSSLDDAENVADIISGKKYIDGKKVKYNGYKPWDGYFSKFSEIEIHTIILSSYNSKNYSDHRWNPKYKVITHN